MPKLTARDGTGLYFEEAGAGPPVLFLHEFAGDHRSWEPQLRHLARHHRCIAACARGYPPSDVPEDPARYGQAIARDDALALLDHLDIASAHIVGHSMGAYTALHLGLHAPGRCRSVAAIGCGWGSDPAERETSKVLCADVAHMFETEPIATAAHTYAHAPMRDAFRAKDPRGFAAFADALAEHSGTGAALTMRKVQAERPTLRDLAEPLAAFAPPLLVLVGDGDAPCLDGSLFLKRTVPGAGLQVVPRAGHTLPSEEPATVNAALAELFAAAEAGRWRAHVP